MMCASSLVRAILNYRYKFMVISNNSLILSYLVALYTSKIYMYAYYMRLHTFSRTYKKLLSQII